MSGSVWNAWSDRILAAKLGAEESRFAWALARYIVGWSNGELGERVGPDGVRRRTKAKAVGRALLREKTGLDGRSSSGPALVSRRRG